MIFDIIDDKPVITGEGINIPEFKVIWNNDSYKHKKAAKAQYAYIYHMCDPRSSYSNLPLDKREKEVVKDFITDGLTNNGSYTRSEFVEAAMAKYKLLTETPSSRLLKSAKNTLNKTAEYFDSVDYTEVDEVTGLAKYDINKVVSALEKIEKLVKSIKRLEIEVGKDLAALTERNRGGVTSGIIEKILLNE